MELKERLEELLKKRYGIESREDLKKAVDELPEIDFGIFVNPPREKGDMKSA